jgi:hypothetical protein
MVDSLSKGSSVFHTASHRTSKHCLHLVASAGHPGGATQLTRTRLLAAVGVTNLTTIQRDCLSRPSRRRMEFASSTPDWQDGLLQTAAGASRMLFLLTPIPPGQTDQIIEPIARAYLQ